MTTSLENRALPIEIEAFGKKGQIIEIIPRTEHTNRYTIKWKDGSIMRYKGARTRPHWIKHVKRRGLR